MSVMMLKKSIPLFIIIAVLLGVSSAYLSTYVFFDQRVKDLEKAYLLQQTHIEQLKHLQAQHTQNLVQLITRLDNVDSAVFEYVETINQAHHKLTAKVVQTNQAVADLLTAVDQKEQVMTTLIPPGTVVAYAGELTTAIRQQLLTAGWLVCDGQTYAIADYPELYQAIKAIYGEQQDTFQVPDFRGIFLRGLDLGKQIDPKRTLGSYQTDSYQAHKHAGQMTTTGLHDHAGITVAGGKHQHRLTAEGYWFTSKLRNERRAMTSDVDDNQKYWTSNNGKHLHGLQIEQSGTHNHKLTITESGEQETRPKNYPIIYLIKI